MGGLWVVHGELTKLQSLDPSDEITISIIVLYELVYGIEDITDKNEQIKAKKGSNLYGSISPLSPWIQKRWKFSRH